MEDSDFLIQISFEWTKQYLPKLLSKAAEMYLRNDVRLNTVLES